MPDGSQPAKPDPDHLGAGVCSAFLSRPCVVGSVRAVPVWPERFFLTGRLPRRFHQVSALGKVLDPVADKITQITIAVMLFLEFHKSTSGAMRAFSWVFLFFLCKEGLMILGGAVMLAVGLRPGAAEILRQGGNLCLLWRDACYHRFLGRAWSICAAWRFAYAGLDDYDIGRCIRHSYPRCPH